MMAFLAPLLILLAPVDAAEAERKQGAGAHQVLRATGPSSSRLRAGTRLPGGATLDLERGDTILLLGPLGTRRYQGPGRYRVGQPVRLGSAGRSATVRTIIAANRSVDVSTRAEVLAGGTIDIAAEIGSACAGFVAVRPERQYLSDGRDLPVIFSVMNAPGAPRDGQLSLLINDPAGEWYCSQGVNALGRPEIRFPGHLAGRYDIWVGYSVRGGRRRAILDIVD